MADRKWKRLSPITAGGSLGLNPGMQLNGNMKDRQGDFVY